MHRMFRSVARVTAVAAIAVGSGAVVAMPPALADIGADMRLVCSGGAGTHEVGLRIETTVPASGTVGQPIQPGTIRIDVGLPPDLVEEVQTSSPDGASAPPVTGVTPTSTPSPDLGGVAEVGVSVREPGQDRSGGWPVFALAAAPPSGDGAVHLTGSGVAPPVVPRSPGGLSWAAGDLDLSLVPGDTTTEDGTAELALHCAAEKETVLGTVRVGRGNEASATGALSGPSPRATVSQEDLCEQLPPPGADPRYAINDKDRELAEIFDSPEMPSSLVEDSADPTAYCIKATGFVNLKKAGNAVPIAAESSARVPALNYRGDIFFGPNWREFHGYFVNRTYPTPATVLGFGFMPTRAVAEAVQVSAPGSGESDPITGNIRVVQLQEPIFALPGVEKQQLRIKSYVRLKAGQVEINGVPVDLGDECMTSPTLLSGDSFLGTRRTRLLRYTEGESVVVEDLNIPAFSGCGVTEDLSPLLTASISGAGNYANIETGAWCNTIDEVNCVDGAGPLPETFTITPGGEVTAVADQFVLKRQFGIFRSEFRCDSATLRFDLNGGHWQSRFRLAKGDFSADDCEVEAWGPDAETPGPVYQVTDVVQEGTLWLEVRPRDDGRLDMQVNGIMLNATVDTEPENGTGTECSLRITGGNQISFLNPTTVEGPGTISGIYDNASHVFSVESNILIPSPESTCNIPGFTRTQNFISPLPVGDFTFPSNLRITQP